ncbi:MAG: hypothetical protein IJF06_00875 [Bacteroidaceae bacterium]|nr:hypothetical protein [Bacteroidaceae bacterium]
MKKKKSILFINGIFESKGCGAFENVAKLLRGYKCVVLQPQARPSKANLLKVCWNAEAIIIGNNSKCSREYLKSVCIIKGNNF